jgi:competence protein ComEC
MQTFRKPYAWKKMPFVRLVIPFTIGIVAQWYIGLPVGTLIKFFIAASLITLAISFLSLQLLYKLRWVQGFLLHVAMFALGALITYAQDIRNDSDWIGHVYNDTGALVITLQEPLVEKAKSYKADASIDQLLVNGSWQNVTGKTIIYFQKDSLKPALVYGNQFVINKPLQHIRNSGNPGAFDYQRYNAFKDIHYQLFLKEGDYRVLPTIQTNALNQWLFSIQTWVVQLLQKRVTGKEESGVAEALLIGYRNDLDKDLVQAYSNTGVVHIIAISGLHLGMIYGIFVLMFKRIRNKRVHRIVKPIVILFVLWMFSLVAGAAPSIVRSAVMFTFIVVGEVVDRKGSIYNTLAGAAFVMLAYNPFYLWDVGFQLSFAAVISIVAFMKPVYNWIYCKNKLLDGIWKLTSVTIAAQVLTAPFIFYYFHQFPLLFMITNFVAVPLSSLILYCELLLIVVSPFESIASFLGNVTSYGIQFMNGFIRHMDNIPMTVYNNIHITLLQAYVLMVMILAGSYWLLFKNKAALYTCLLFCVCFLMADAYEKYQLYHRNQVIVYNIPKHAAIDIAEADQYTYVGDSAVTNDPFLVNFHLKPSRINYWMDNTNTLVNVYSNYPFVYAGAKKLLLLDRPLKFANAEKISVDAIVISRNPKIYISQLNEVFDCKQYVFDASNPVWKINLWKKDCDSLHLPHHSTPEKGAYIMQF